MVLARRVGLVALALAAHAASKGSTRAQGRYHSAHCADAACTVGLDVSDARIPGIGYRPSGLARGT